MIRSIIGLPADLTGCGNYRIMNPLKALSRLGIDTYITTEAVPEAVRGHDIALFQRPIYDAAPQLIEIVKATGGLALVETDDLLEGVQSDNPAIRTHYRGSAALKSYTRSIASASGLTVTTPELAQHYSGVNPNVATLPNLIDFGYRPWPKPKFNEGKTIRLGWSGGVSHAADLAIMGRVIAAALSAHPQLIYSHYGPPEILKAMTIHYGISEDRCELIECRPFEWHPEGLSGIDIGLAPIENNEFNRSKSPVKLMEYSAVGVPFVASKVAPYARHTDEGKDGFLADTPAEWAEAIGTLVEDTERRREMATYAYEKAKTNFDLDRGIHQYIEAFERLRDTPADAAIPTEKPGRNDRCPCGSGIKYKRCCYPAFG